MGSNNKTGLEWVSRRFLPIVERANMASGGRPKAMSSVELEILRLPTADERALAQDILLRSQDAFRIGVVVLFVQIGALSPETQYPCGFPAGATLAR